MTHPEIEVMTKTTYSGLMAAGMGIWLAACGSSDLDSAGMATPDETDLAKEAARAELAAERAADPENASGEPQPTNGLEPVDAPACS